MLVTNLEIEELASKLDVDLCDACGALRMRDRDLDEDTFETRRDEDATSILISTVRRDIANLANEMRLGFGTLTGQFQILSERVRTLELKDATNSGKVDGIKSTMAALAVICSLAGGLIGWLISLITKRQ